MEMLFDHDKKRPRRFSQDEFCAYCGEPLPQATEENREWVDDGFCTKDCSLMFYAEDELADEPDYFDEDREELKTLIRDEKKTRTGEIPTFEGERP